MKRILILLFQIFGYLISAQDLDTAIVNISRKSTLQILCYNDNGSLAGTGTGFFVKTYDIYFVVTNAHVVTYKLKNTVNSFNKIKGVMANGDTIALGYPPISNAMFNDYVKHDFALLTCKKTPKNAYALKLLDKDEKSFIGEKVYFSGYPLGQPLLTHSGTISGITNDSLIYIQSPVNNGNSGGALINKNGKVIGIINSKILSDFVGLEQYAEKIENYPIIPQDINFGSYTMSDGTKDSISYGPVFNYKLVKTLSSSLNVGIGCAIDVKFMRKCLLEKGK